MIRRDRHTGDRIAAAILLVVSIVLLVTSIRYKLFTGSAPGPGLFPAIVATLLVVLALLWLVTGAGAGAGADPAPQRLTSPALETEERVSAPVARSSAAAPELALAERVSAEAAEAADAPAVEDVSIDRAGARRIIFVVAWTLVPLLLLDRIGYLVAMTAYVGGLLVVIARTRPWVALLGALAGAAITQFGGDRLGIFLPDPLGLLQSLGL